MKEKQERHKIEYIIEHAELPVGEHIFEFEIDTDFMNQYQVSENTYQIHAQIVFIKHNHSLQAIVKLKGNISVNCDKCLIPYTYPVNSEARLLIKKGKPENSTDEILMVEEDDNKINFSQYIYESISLALPYKIVPCELFDNVNCDEVVLKKINQNLSEQNKSITFAEILKNKFNK